MRQREWVAMLAAHLFEERQPCSGEAGVAIHAVERKGPKLLPPLRVALGGERLTALAGTPGRNSAPGATLPLPEAGAAALRTLSALTAEAPDEFGGPNLRVWGALVSILEYTLDRGSHRAPFFPRA